VAVALVAITVVLFVHDRVPAPERFVDARPTLAEAIGRWAAQLPDAARKEPDERTADNAYPVFLVATEGGGIRSAYWTALVLWRLSAAIPDFHRRTFALSGASGGALGLAVYRGCTDASADAAAVRACIEEFGATDLWTQLLGGMFFEDAIAAVMPTQWCALPGCGVLGRSYWFEGALERAVPGLARGLAGPTPAAHAPHLFLGVTRVETGERVLQSDVRIFEAEFPGTRDLVTTMGADLRLSTAGHNSSRFPYTNPVGALYGPGCPEVPRALAAIGASLAARGDRGLCMQLQDGGYFDNSGARAASDLLRALIQRLPAFRCPLGLAASLADSSCAKRMEWIKPVVIEIRNNYTLAPAPDERRPPVCAPSRVSPVDPGRAEAKPPFALYPSVLTAALTTLQTRTAHMRNFEAELERDAAAAWLAQGLAVPQDVPSTCPAGVAAWLPARPFHRFDLVNDGVLFPSGWMLSQRARRGIEREAACGVPYVGDPPGDCAGAVARKR
jgi:hypothetical protein